jgi:hypothetical protein
LCNDAHACAAVVTCFWRISSHPERVSGRPWALTKSSRAGVVPRTASQSRLAAAVSVHHGQVRSVRPWPSTRTLGVGEQSRALSGRLTRADTRSPAAKHSWRLARSRMPSRRCRSGTCRRLCLSSTVRACPSRVSVVLAGRARIRRRCASRAGTRYARTCITDVSATRRAWRVRGRLWRSVAKEWRNAMISGASSGSRDRADGVRCHRALAHGNRSWKASA